MRILEVKYLHSKPTGLTVQARSVRSNLFDFTEFPKELDTLPASRFGVSCTWDTLNSEGKVKPN